jgi:hypothetical protein
VGVQPALLWCQSPGPNTTDGWMTADILRHAPPHFQFQILEAAAWCAAPRSHVLVSVIRRVPESATLVGPGPPKAATDDTCQPDARSFQASIHYGRGASTFTRSSNPRPAGRKPGWHSGRVTSGVRGRPQQVHIISRPSPTPRLSRPWSDGAAVQGAHASPPAPKCLQQKNEPPRPVPPVTKSWVGCTGSHLYWPAPGSRRRVSGQKQQERPSERLVEQRQLK